MFNNADPVYRDVYIALERDRSLHAAERHELEEALRDLARRRRSARHQRRRHWFDRLRPVQRRRRMASRPA